MPEASANPASRKGQPPFFPLQPPVPERPRKVGITHVLDRLHGLEPSELRPLAGYVDIVKIGWGLPLLVSREELRKRVRFYHDIGLEVSTGGTLLEHAITKDRELTMMDEARTLGFDLIEISDGIIELSPAQVERLEREVRTRSIDCLIEVGKKNPQNQLSLRETIDRTRHALGLKPRKVILESRESGRGVGIYDGEGAIKWDWVRSITAEFAAEDLIFEAPLESQQIQLLRDLGAETNLGNVALSSVAPLASQRLGLRGDTFGSIR